MEMKQLKLKVLRWSMIGLVLSLPCLTVAGPISIGIIGDQTGATDLDKAYQVMAQGVAALNRHPGNLDVVIHVGDLVESTQDVNEITRRFKQAESILSKLKAPWYAVVGDHDVNPPSFRQNSPDRSRERLFMRLYSTINPLVKDQLYYSFDIKDYHFVMLYALEHLHTDPRWGNVYYSNISDTQLQWLQKDLQDNAPGKNGIIVVIHQPMWYIWSNWERVHQVLSQYPVKAVIAGHYHYNQTQPTLDGIVYQVVGATGGDTKLGNQNSGNLQHVTVLNIDGGVPSFEMIPLPPFVQSQWTEQQTMDRIQAIDTNLGNLWSFKQDNPVYLQNGKLVAACGSQNPAKLAIKGIGNANADPVTVTITIDGGPGVTVVNSFMGAELCQSDVTPFGCQLAPSAGVAISNNSLVQMSEYPAPQPLWTGTLTVNDVPPAIGTAITAKVSMSFVRNDKEYRIHRSGITTVDACP